MSFLDTELMIKKLNKLIDRPLFEDERVMVYKWYDTWDFDRDVILYAFDVTTNRITQTSHYIRYMDAMLQSWKDDGLNSLDEIKASVGQKENVKVNYRNVQRHVLFEREPVYIRYGLADVKPCPFCGSYDIVVKNQFSSNHNGFFSLAEYRKLCMQYGETASPDRKAAYDESMKKTGGKMNGACMFWDSKGNKTLSYHPITGDWDAINNEAEFARARKFTSIYNDELKRLSNEYGEKARGTVSLKQIHDDLGASVKTSSTAGTGGTIDITV